MHQLKREALLREAIAAFNQKGFHATSLGDIATSLGVTKAALYHYFPNKHALLYEAFAEALRVGFEAIESAERAGGTGLEKLQMALREYLEVTLSEMSRCVIITEEHALEPEDRARIVEQRDRFEAKLRGFVREGIDDGSVIPCDPKLAIFSIFGAVNWVPKWFSDSGAWSNRQLAKGMSELLCRSIAKQPPAAFEPDIAKMRVD
ncbi:TetR/AcrR family transcriptional regulator [Bordetella petrii]|uniref:TetR/AcrR family transcriptional regulator n=1 Tax=Bordetella petrii TaxID=94624 RepID=A0ABT7VZS4_9BORD|nr:TetR/AcrR family transcriptional regulator [Bordetella petrii]MDM9558445.1 TetR/AcrR family transcriptional regulator [Bordetella petrii]